MSRRILPNSKATKQSSSPPLTTPQVALYMRVSTEDQAERGTIGAQRDFLRQFAVSINSRLPENTPMMASRARCSLVSDPMASASSRMPRLGALAASWCTASTG